LKKLAALTLTWCVAEDQKNAAGLCANQNPENKTARGSGISEKPLSLFFLQ
jgi:hypothetical protein